MSVTTTNVKIPRAAGRSGSSKGKRAGRCFILFATRLTVVSFDGSTIKIDREDPVNLLLDATQGKLRYDPIKIGSYDADASRASSVFAGIACSNHVARRKVLNQYWN